MIQKYEKQTTQKWHKNFNKIINNAYTMICKIQIQRTFQL